MVTVDDTTTGRRRLRRAVPVVAIALLALSGCARDAQQDTWQPAGENAQDIHNLQWPVFLIAGIVLVIVIVAVGFIVVRFRDRGQPMPEQSHGNPVIEIALTILPAVILIGIGIPTVSTIFALSKTDDTECRINVTGQQWWWEYSYPVQSGCLPGGITEPIVTSGQLVIPTDTNVMLYLSSRDVIHSYWIPKLNGKRDAVPGRIHTLRMQADTPGLYAGQCTEFCGLSHAYMRMEAAALEGADFATWVSQQTAPYAAPADADSLAGLGEATFTANCAYCHQVDGLTALGSDGSTRVPVLADPDEFVVSGAAPNLTHLMSRNTFAGSSFDLLTPECRDRVWNAKPEEFGALYLQGVTPECLNEIELREWIRDAPAKKPMYSSEAQKAATGGLVRGMPNLGMSETQIDELIAYLLERK